MKALYDADEEETIKAAHKNPSISGFYTIEVDVPGSNNGVTENEETETIPGQVGPE
jgi:hypothetical protein